MAWFPNVGTADLPLSPSRRVRKSLVAVGVISFLVVILLRSMSYAATACQPYAPDPSFLENLENIEELILELPGSQPLSPEQKARLKAVAQRKLPDQIGELARLEVFWRLSRAVPLPNPRTGPAPLTVEIVWPKYPIASPSKIEFDPDGDGKAEWVEERYEAVAPRQYIYQQEGKYEFTVRVHDNRGQVHLYSSSVVVFSPGAFDAELQARWSGLKEALRRGDTSAALECIHTHSRSRYKEVFSAILSGLSQKVDQTLTTIRFVDHHRGLAIYEMLRSDGGVTSSFEIRFGIDVDGVWRITSF